MARPLDPENSRHHIFMPKNVATTATSEVLPPLSSHGSQTPIPKRGPGGTPAWDPYSATPRRELSPACGPCWGNDMPLSTTVGHQIVLRRHWMRDPRLLGHVLQVLVRGQTKFAEVVNYGGGDRLTFAIHEKGYRFGGLDENDIMPFHPGKTDRSRWIVIDGEHCGKLVRGIQRDATGPVTKWRVVVVKRRQGEEDELTGEHLVFELRQLNLIQELTGEVFANASLARRIRLPAITVNTPAKKRKRL